MPIKRERPIPGKEHLEEARGNSLDWEAAHIFLEIAQAGSFRAAADKLDQSVNALRRRFEKLERNLGTMLLTRHVDGVRLTQEGERMLAAARAMEEASFELVRGHSLDRVALSGEVKLAITEGLGTFWVVPHLIAYRRRHPDLTINLQCTMSPVDILRLEADIAIQLEQPKAKDLKIRKIGRLHSMPFAAKSYVAEWGNPRTYADLMHHQIVWQDANQVTPLIDFPPALQAVVREGRTSMRTNSSSAHYWAIASGLGIGALATYAYAVSDLITPVHVNLRTQHDIWLVYHPDAGRMARVQAVIEWLAEIFSPRKNPWFGDKFIHPEEFASLPVPDILHQSMRSRAGEGWK